MNIKESVTTCLFQKPLTLRGRASRSEFWWFAAAAYLFTNITPLVSGSLLVSAIETGSASAMPRLAAVVFLLNVAAGIWFTVAQTTAAVRRLHDTGRSGWWLALPAAWLPACLFTGAILGLFGIIDPDVDEYPEWIDALVSILLICFVAALSVLLALRGTPGANRFGPATEAGSRIPCESAAAAGPVVA